VSHVHHIPNVVHKRNQTNPSTEWHEAIARPALFSEVDDESVLVHDFAKISAVLAIDLVAVHFADVNRPGFLGGSNSREWSHEEVPEVFTRGA